MTYVEQLNREVEERANARTPEVIARLIDRIECRAFLAQQGAYVAPGCHRHDHHLKAYTQAAIDLTRAKRSAREGGKLAWSEYNAAKRRYYELREVYHSAVFRCGCSTKYDDEISSRPHVTDFMPQMESQLEFQRRVQEEGQRRRMATTSRTLTPEEKERAHRRLMVASSRTLTPEENTVLCFRISPYPKISRKDAEHGKTRQQVC